ncbi:histidine kinase [Comamonas thiooxydans]|uniref:histidine kinase n=1 Tax=Comamonas thiooxydans TaxID=363952 RepID=A0A0E3BVJ3_9BURK|nr:MULTISPECIES: ATP-binding protein [Pseudomonadota]MDN4684207.1 ATP-binding protein [Pseudomonas aeruginosa]KGH09986.1 histidine kinase [Comamonas thiooxydans]KGH15647.1 histidine kinase [Comamonas thiooxydans]MCD0497223.1 two-component sensor histidine kinase [Achromobacter sp. MY14]MDP5439765.1 ATP-binding protein [Pseudomonas aeruginosa]
MSLRLRAVLIAGIALLVLWGAAAGWMMRGVQANLDRTLDGRLAMSARMVSGLLDRAALGPQSTSTDFSEAVRISGSEGIACEIRSLRGEVLARTIPSPHSAFDDLPAGLSTREVEGQQWRVYVLRTDGYQITTADRIDQRHVLTQEMLRAAGVPFLIAFLGGLAALWIGIGRGLSPLKNLRRQLRSKEVDDTTPIEVQHAPKELRPVLDAMNALMGRLAQALSSQRAFTDAAAHELRTPLTVIDTHLQVIRLTDGEEAQSSLSSAEEGVRRLRRTLDQMMTLAHAEATVEPADRCESVWSCVNDALDTMEGTARARVSLTTQGDDAGSIVPRSMLGTAIRNLVDNALRYSPEQTRIEVSVQFDNAEKHCTIRVADRGPGLSAEQATQAGRRFWRADHGRKRSDGAGLGISIVRAIAERFDGTLTLKPRDGGGLVAELTLPLQTQPYTTQ